MASLSPTQGKMTITTEAIRASFLIPAIPKIPGCSTYEIIYKVTNMLGKNAASMQSTLDGG
eukprot:5450585-Ditylum_brightwellii.AAC.1